MDMPDRDENFNENNYLGRDEFKRYADQMQLETDIQLVLRLMKEQGAAIKKCMTKKHYHQRVANYGKLLDISARMHKEVRDIVGRYDNIIATRNRILRDSSECSAEM